MARLILICFFLASLQSFAQNTIQSCEQNSYRLRLSKVHVLKFEEARDPFATKFQSYDRDGFSPEIAADVTCSEVIVKSNVVSCKNGSSIIEVGRVGTKIGVDGYGQYFTVTWNPRAYVRTSLDARGGCKYTVAVKRTDALP